MNAKLLWMQKFVAALFFTTVIATIVWGRFIDGYLYSCSDGVMGYPLPADLLALSHDKWPLKTVPIIDQPTGMNDPDLIKEGWTAAGLWVLWASFLGISLAISIALASLVWPTLRREL